jgi:nucleotide-binding universal stress UspA family protein
MRILLAVTNSSCSIAAARAIAERPWQAGSEVRILSVVETPLIMPVRAAAGFPELPSTELVERVESVLTNNALIAVRDAVQELMAHGPRELRISANVVDGDPATGILKEAEQWGANLIVLGSCGPEGWRRLLRQGPAMAVVKHAKCSVEVVRSEPIIDDHPTAVAAGKEAPNGLSYAF